VIPAEVGVVPRLHQGVLEFDHVIDVPRGRLAEEDLHPQGTTRGAPGRQQDPPPPAGALRLQQAAGFQQLQGGKDGLRVHPELLRQQGGTGYQALPLPAQKLVAQVSGDLLGGRENLKSLHPENLANHGEVSRKNCFVMEDFAADFRPHSTNRRSFRSNAGTVDRQVFLREGVKWERGARKLRFPHSRPPTF
jgi:hypothetical protein